MKKTLLLITSLILCMSIFALWKKGDVNQDGAVDVADITTLASIILSGNPNGYDGDVNKDGTVDVADITAVASIILNGDEDDGTTGSASAKDLGEVGWVQLWEGGPKWATVNVGVASTTATGSDLCGGYYPWGSTVNGFANPSSSNEDIHGTADDTAMNLWGSNWIMPTYAQMQALLDNCNREWTVINGAGGLKLTGKTAPYDKNSIFLPAMGRYDTSGQFDPNVLSGEDIAYYWTSTPYDKTFCYSFDVDHFGLMPNVYRRSARCNVRAILNETTH